VIANVANLPTKLMSFEYYFSFAYKQLWPWLFLQSNRWNTICENGLWNILHIKNLCPKTKYKIFIF